MILKKILFSRLSKIIEKLMKKEYYINNIRYPRFGFQSSKSTVVAIFFYFEQVYINLNNGKSAIICDFSKDFDCVNQQPFWKYII